MRSASNPTSRAAAQLVGDALRLMHADLPLIPLYRRTLTWVMRPDISVAQWPNDILELRFVEIGDRATDWDRRIDDLSRALPSRRRSTSAPARASWSPST